jgi:hypothetical protein
MAPQFDRLLRELLRGAGCTLVRQGKGSGTVRSRGEISRFQLEFRAATRPMPSCGRQASRRHFEGVVRRISARGVITFAKLFEMLHPLNVFEIVHFLQR